MDRYRVTKGDGRSYLCTLTFIRWLPVLNFGESYLRIISDSLNFSRIRKGMLLRAYVLMPDHLHLIARHDDLSSVMREFKSWTSREITGEMRRENRMDALRIMSEAAEGKEDTTSSVWQSGFHPKAITSDAMMLQKLQYVHANPVRKGYVSDPAHWRFSSAGYYLLAVPGPVQIDPFDPLIL